MSDDEYEVPLQDQRVFGAGIKRKRVKFVPSTSSENSTTAPPTQSSAQDVASRYLNLVLPSKNETNHESSPASSSALDSSGGSSDNAAVAMCETCNIPVETVEARKHHTSLAHQVSLPHSHPPSHIDRKRKGLSILSSYGWDPDARKGLGSEGQGMRFPIKTNVKEDKLGVGVVVPKNALQKAAEEKAARKEERRRLDAGQIRKRDVEDKRKREQLQREFYGRDDVERLLRGG